MSERIASVDVDWEAFRAMIIEARRRAGLTRTDLAHRIGWPGAIVVRDFEAGRLNPTTNVVAAMISVLGPELVAMADEVVR